MENLTNSILSTAQDLQFVWISSALTLGAFYIDLSGIDECYDTPQPTGGMNLVGNSAKGGTRILGWSKLNHPVIYKVQRQSALFDTAKRILIKNDGNPASIVQNGQLWTWSPSSGIVDHYLGAVLFGIDGFGLSASKVIKEANVTFNATDYRSANYQAISAIANIVQGLFSSTEAKQLQQLRVAESHAKIAEEKRVLRQQQAELEKRCQDKKLNVVNSQAVSEFGITVHNAELKNNQGQITDQQLSDTILRAEEKALTEISKNK
jgi:hypothetical protein